MTFIPEQLIQKTAFDEQAVEQKTPQIQAKFSYGINPAIMQSLTNGTGSTVTSANSNAIVTCEGAANKFSQIRTFDTLAYAPGQGGLFMGTCIFTPGVALSSQVFGVGDDDEGYFWGYDGVDFGVVRRSRGSLEIKSIEITAGATNSGNITITLDGGPVVVAVLAGDTIAQVTEKIVALTAEFGNAARGWEIHTDENINVEFISLVAEEALGAFTFVDTDTTGVTAGAFSTSVLGRTPTAVWVKQTDFNKDKLDGTGPSGMTLDTTKGNVFRIQFQYLGYGAIEYSLEDPITGNFILAHRVQYANDNIVPTIENPTLFMTMIAKTETGYTGGDLVMKTASVAAFIQGKQSPQILRGSSTGTKSVTTTENVVLILHNEIDFQGFINRVGVFPDLISLSTEATKITIVRVIKEPTRVDAGAELINVESGVSVMEFSTVGTTVAGGQTLFNFSLAPGASKEIKFEKDEFRIRPGERIVFAARHTSGAAAPVTASVSWQERI